MSEAGRKLHAIVVTYRRPEPLSTVLVEIGSQTRPPDTITVVDNDPDRSASTVVAAQQGIALVSTGENLGPAGGLAVGVSTVLAYANDEDCIVFVDDDDPPPHRNVLEKLMGFRHHCPVSEDRVGAVGLAGGSYSRRTGLLRRLPDQALSGAVPVSYLGGGHYPVYSVRALRVVGATREDLFFGFEELELGLRLDAAGYSLFGDGEVWAKQRSALGRASMSARRASAIRPRDPWRRYYSTRNLIWIARAHGGRGAPLVATIRSGVLPAVADVVRQRSVRAAGPSLRGLRDAWLGRLGRTVPPS